jgi:hypothetical protein
MLHRLQVFSLILAFNCVGGFLLQGNPRRILRPIEVSSTNKEKEPWITSSEQYLSSDDRPYLIGEKPDSAVKLGLRNFRKELSGIFTQIGNSILKTEESKLQQFPDILNLRLSNELVKRTELERIQANGGVDAHPIAKKLYDIGCSLLDTLFDERPMERFWFLEIIARIPYFVYVSMLHLYESFGWWRAPSVRKVHCAEEWNELHHLLIMETLGGDRVSFLCSFSMV